jgi:hypothetical protein
MEFSDYGGLPEDHYDYLSLGGKSALAAGMGIAAILGTLFFDWQYSSTALYLFVALILGALAYAFFFCYVCWVNTGPTAPMWFLWSRNAAFVSACWPGLLMGLVAMPASVYFGKLLGQGWAANLLLAVITLAMLWAAGKVAIISARNNIRNGHRLKNWIQ